MNCRNTMDEQPKAKSHHKRQSGPKAEKKAAKAKKGSHGENAKAFTYKSAVRAARATRRNLDKESKRQHVPTVDRTPLEPPPVCVAVVGPPKVGKTTLIHDLVKNYTRQNLSEVKGPITVVSGKKRRLTIIECGNDLNTMIDIAKVADLVLLLVDASFGFEMETFEFLNILQTHGFPKVMGVLTHLDMFHSTKTLRKTKKKLKQRFWTEIYQGAKLFYLSGLIHGHYPKADVHNLARFISVMKFRPPDWRGSHPYVIADRLEDLTDPEELRQNPKVDRNISLYGFVRGTHLKPHSAIHIPGCGDFSLSSVSSLPDPCPLPDKLKKRSLNEKEKLIYAPMTGVGGIVYDKDAVYIDLGGSHAHKGEGTGPNDLVTSIMETRHPLDAKMKQSQVALFKNAVPMLPEDVKGIASSTLSPEGRRQRRRVEFGESDGESDSDSEGDESDNDEEEEEGEGQGEELQVSKKKRRTHIEKRSTKRELSASASSDDGEISDDPSTWKLSAYTRQKARRRKPAERNFVTSSNSGSNHDNDNNSDDSESHQPLSSSCEEHEGESEEEEGESESVSESFEAGAAGFFDDEAMEASFSSELEEMEYEGSAESEVDDGEGEGWEERGGDEGGSRGFIVDEAEEEELYQAQKRRRRRRAVSSSSSSSDGDSDAKSDRDREVNLNLKRAKFLGSTNEESSSDGETTCAKNEKASKLVRDEESADSSSSEESEQEKFSARMVEYGQQNSFDESSVDEEYLLSDISGDESEGTSENADEAESDKDAPGSLKWKRDLLTKAREAYDMRNRRGTSLRKLVYSDLPLDHGHKGEISEDAQSQEDEDERSKFGGLFQLAKRKEALSMNHRADTSLPDPNGSKRPVKLSCDWSDSLIVPTIKSLFVTGGWGESDARALLEEDEAMYGDFEDLETGEKHGTGAPRESAEDRQNGSVEDEEMAEQKRLKKKKSLKVAFDVEYDDKTGGEGGYLEDLKREVSEQEQRNRAEFEGLDEQTRVQYEGFRPGTYVRMEIKGVPCEFVEYFDPHYPVIVGGVLPGEGRLGYIRVRLKKHRWHKRVLKTRDPLIISLGWRRFQTTPIYCIEDHNMRQRMLKYTPEHMHCSATFYGPQTSPGTGLLGVQSVGAATKAAEFRIAATGVVLELDKSSAIMKKLKLIGTPHKIFKNTAFVKGMFNSALECVKFEGASIRTVSGIRGQIKKALRSPEGAFRATFEDRILKSDIVFARTWYPVSVPKFYNPVTSLLKVEKSSWNGMRTVGQIRYETATKPLVKKNSLYKPVVRETRRFNPLRIPATLQKQLPFKSKPKLQEKRKGKTLSSRRAVILEPDEKRVVTLMQQLATIHKDKAKRRRLRQKEKQKAYLAEKAKQEAKRLNATRRLKKEFYREVGKAEKKTKRR